MSFSLEKAFSIFPEAIKVHERRSEVIANNLVNQDTPGFKAQDLDFRSALQAIQQNTDQAREMKTNNASHQSNLHQLALEHIQYRTGFQPSLDGNTVDGQIEQTEFAENSMRYMANLNFLSGRIQGLLYAIKGTR